MATVPGGPAVRPIMEGASRRAHRGADVVTRQRRWVVLGSLAAAAGVTLLAAAFLLVGRGEAAAARPAPRFVEESESAGVVHAYDGEFRFFTGGGVAVLDCDDDGRPDLYLAGGAAPASLFLNESPVGGALRFTRLPSAETDLADVTGAYPIDIDADGATDLVVLRDGENVVLRGTGDCGFERANEAWGIDGGAAWTTAFSATWEDDDHLPTLAFGNYLAVGEEAEAASECEDNELIRPDGSRYGDPIPLSPGWCTLSLLFSDWDGTGRRDLRVSNDRHYYREGEEQLWRIEPGAVPKLWTAAEGWRTVRVFGMGIASRDLTGDGRPEVYLTSQGDNKLQSLAGDAGRPEYEDIALERGATAHRPYVGDVTMPSTAWHPEFDDVNNDGFVDLFVSKGNVEAMTDYAARDPSNLLLGQPDGTFVEGAEEAGIASFDPSRGAALTDLNLDGLLDLVVVHRRENVGLWRNAGDPDGHEASGWLALQLRQEGANRDAVGAKIDVRAGEGTWHTELTIGGGHASGELGWTHVGIGAEDHAEVRVTWPDGEIGPWQRMDASGFGIIERGEIDIRRWSPGEEVDG